MPARRSCTTARSSTDCSDPSRAPRPTSRTANTGGKPMTTHETQPEFAEPAVRDDRVATAEPMPAQASEQVVDPPLETVDATGNVEAPMQRAETAGDPADSTVSADSGGQMLFADGDLSDLRLRWTEVQSAFVDDPRDCVQ